MLITHGDYELKSRLDAAEKKISHLHIPKTYKDGECVISCDASWRDKVGEIGYGISVGNYNLEFVEVLSFVFEIQKILMIFSRSQVM